LAFIRPYKVCQECVHRCEGAVGTVPNRELEAETVLNIC
jgi:hypothetical protein